MLIFCAASMRGRHVRILLLAALAALAHAEDFVVPGVTPFDSGIAVIDDNNPSGITVLGGRYVRYPHYVASKFPELRPPLPPRAIGS